MSRSWWQRFKSSSAHTQANIVCTMIIMLATVGYAGIAGRQLFLINRQIGIMQDTLDEMKRSGQQSTQQMWSAIGNINWMARSMDWNQKVAQQTIESGEKQSKTALQAAVDNFHQEQRAWIAVTSVHGTSPDNDAFEIMVEITNTGLTPARNVAVYPSFIFADPAYQVPLTDDVAAQHLGLLSPKGDRTINWRKKTDQVLNSASSDFIKSRRVTVLGRITYDDEFGRSHWITYCATSSTDWSKFTFCDSHNDADVEAHQRQSK